MSAAHIAVFAWIGLRAPMNAMRPMDDLRPVEVFLVPPPPPPPPRPARGGAPLVSPAPYRPRLVLPAAPEGVPSIPAPIATPGPPAPAARPAPTAVGPTAWDGLKGALRGSPVGCGNRDRVALTAAEREACNEKQGLAAARATPLGLGLETGKQGRFDQAADARARLRREREGSMTNLLVPCKGPSSNLGGACNPGHE